jgi:SWI/SNF related-matrix-associated actin-dependent regulator of chromatin subfamily C
VADHVNQQMHGGDITRSHDDCILAFIRLPIEDPYLALEETATPVGRTANESYPLIGAKNPLLATLAFLSQAVDPAVAAAGAKSAIGELGGLAAAEPTSSTAASGGGSAAEIVAAESDAGDVMEVDGAAPAAPADAATAKAPPAVAGVSKAKLGELAAKVLQSAGTKAQQLATVEEERMKALIASLVQAQLAKLELKLRLFEKLEDQLEGDIQKCAEQRSALARDRILFQQRVQAVEQHLNAKEVQVQTAEMAYGEPVVARMLGVATMPVVTAATNGFA